MPLHDLIIADSRQKLEAGLDRLRDLDPIGVDVERADWDRYFRTPALIQVGGQGRVTVVDPLAINDLEPLAQFLAGRVTVFHAVENDLPPLLPRGVEPPRVEDTAVAAALLGFPTGLAALLDKLLGVSLDGDKAAMQRADWEARPLSVEMLAYAAADVVAFSSPAWARSRRRWRPRTAHAPRSSTTCGGSSRGSPPSSKTTCSPRSARPSHGSARWSAAGSRPRWTAPSPS